MKNKVNVIVIDMPILDTRKYADLKGVGQLITDLVLQILAWLSEEERLGIKERQREGIQSAKLRNIKFGRPKIMINENFTKVYSEWKNNKITARRAMEVLGFKSNTFYRRVAEYEHSIREVKLNG